ncbi:MAG: hypothetical protein JJ959_12485 [Nisaea sp.]|uniref:hypothetical protein n=1 Tax=Nisaea sp. TaxID=2024842 RepID=UPI001AFE3C46|nr:hypothetical protein [Nisaea sp.]MBO6561351.1 hypothetical protein [Nisaea sp.]
MTTTPSSTSAPRRRAVFFLRHHNDIDHITPIIWRWAREPGHDALVVITELSVSLGDFRLRFLERQPAIEVIWKGTLVERTAKALGRGDSSRSTAGEIVQYLMSDGIPLVLAFDWVGAELVASVVKASKLRGVKTVSLPHGDDPYVNYLITRDEIDFSEVGKWFNNVPIFDILVSPSTVHAKRAGPKWKHKNRVLGSPRYCPEWRGQLRALLAPIETAEMERNLKIVFFIRNAKYAVFWEEFTRLLSLVMQFPNINLVVVRHPRHFEVDGQEEDVPLPDPRTLPLKHSTSRLAYVASDAYHSSQWIGWSDVVFSLGTTAVYEAILDGKPVFEIEYLHPNRSVVSTMFRNSDVQSRDHIYDWIKRLCDDRAAAAAGFYRKEELDRFRRECIEPGGADVLGGYVEMLKELADSGQLGYSGT